MISKRFFSIIAAVILVTGFNTNAFAEFFSFGVGVPITHTFTSEWKKTGDTVESDGVSGAFVHMKFPIMLGVGYENYTTQLKPIDDTIDDMSITINMIDVFWLTPVPVVNITLGAGLGTTEINCEYTSGGSCKDTFEDPAIGSAYQWYLQLGYEFLPFLDAHLSYHNVTAKVKNKDDSPTNPGDEGSLNGSVIGIGVAVIF
jgi:hypothetical protein